jgi:hypothetical protein
MRARQALLLPRVRNQTALRFGFQKSSAKLCIALPVNHSSLPRVYVLVCVYKPASGTLRKAQHHER